MENEHILAEAENIPFVYHVRGGFDFPSCRDEIIFECGARDTLQDRMVPGVHIVLFFAVGIDLPTSMSMYAHVYYPVSLRMHIGTEKSMRCCDAHTWASIWHPLLCRRRAGTLVTRVVNHESSWHTVVGTKLFAEEKSPDTNDCLNTNRACPDSSARSTVAEKYEVQSIRWAITQMSEDSMYSGKCIHAR